MSVWPRSSCGSEADVRGVPQEWRRGRRGRGEFQAFVAQEGELLETYATYSALDEALHRDDPNVWICRNGRPPTRTRRRPNARLPQARWRAVMLRQYVQWQIDIQLRRAQQKARDRRRSIGLYHDLARDGPFRVRPVGPREFFVAGARVGSPPDDFRPGPGLGLPPPRGAAREDGYRLFSEFIRKNCRHGGPCASTT